ncbi:hypothetical protein [Piscinibacter koreensis]|uniref:Oligosaccharide repeat unit polymerase n=1 Tax=Piscinibacter koreensis TaxID=2742824 RepID=A0A7Y6NRX6_9BURK|nr:hypothetical protein [Schlegelella koreensis]NUZ08184.1 hypothetical protein [Schlegelella koreensis]
MSEFEFLLLALAKWKTLGALSVAFVVILYLSIRRVVAGGIFDPMMLTLVAGYSVNYAVVALLYLNDLASGYLTLLVFAYGLTLIGVYRRVSRGHGRSSLLAAVWAVAPRSRGPTAFAISLGIYLLLSLYVISSIGFGIFSETNRFDAAAGFGSYIRVLDLLSPFIVGYSTLHIHAQRRRRRVKIAGLALFIGYAAMVSGAKISVILSLLTVFFTLSLVVPNLRVRATVAIPALVAGVAFSMLALSINLERNNIDESASATDLAGAGFVVERFLYRLIASGDTSYLLLPNDVIDRIATDSAWIRFAAPLVGTGNITNLLGYPVGDYSVGRQAVLYHDPSFDVFGGPTSHFDLFAYVYFGPFLGWFFVALLGWLLGTINRAVVTVKARMRAPINTYGVALLVTVWTRAVLMIVEPTVALAYLFDAFLYFGFLALVLPSARSHARAHPQRAGDQLQPAT